MYVLDKHSLRQRQKTEGQEHCLKKTKTEGQQRQRDSKDRGTGTLSYRYR